MCNFSFLSVNVSRYTEYYIDVRRRTVRPEKSTRFPERFPRNLPCFPLSRWQNARMGFFSFSWIPGRSLLMYWATTTCRPYLRGGGEGERGEGREGGEGGEGRKEKAGKVMR